MSIKIEYWVEYDLAVGKLHRPNRRMGFTVDWLKATLAELRSNDRWKIVSVTERTTVTESTERDISTEF